MQDQGMQRRDIVTPAQAHEPYGDYGQEGKMSTTLSEEKDRESDVYNWDQTSSWDSSSVRQGEASVRELSSDVAFTRVVDQTPASSGNGDTNNEEGTLGSPIGAIGRHSARLGACGKPQSPLSGLDWCGKDWPDEDMSKGSEDWTGTEAMEQSKVRSWAQEYQELSRAEVRRLCQPRLEDAAGRVILPESIDDDGLHQTMTRDRPPGEAVEGKTSTGIVLCPNGAELKDTVEVLRICALLIQPKYSQQLKEAQRRDVATRAMARMVSPDCAEEERAQRLQELNHAQKRWFTMNRAALRLSSEGILLKERELPVAEAS